MVYGRQTEPGVAPSVAPPPGEAWVEISPGTWGSIQTGGGSSGGTIENIQLPYIPNAPPGSYYAAPLGSLPKPSEPGVTTSASKILTPEQQPSGSLGGMSIEQQNETESIARSIGQGMYEKQGHTIIGGLAVAFQPEGIAALMAKGKTPKEVYHQRFWERTARERLTGESNIGKFIIESPPVGMASMLPVGFVIGKGITFIASMSALAAKGISGTLATAGLASAGFKVSSDVNRFGIGALPVSIGELSVYGAMIGKGNSMGSMPGIMTTKGVSSTDVTQGEINIGKGKGVYETTAKPFRAITQTEFQIRSKGDNLIEMATKGTGKILLSGTKQPSEFEFASTGRGIPKTEGKWLFANKEISSIKGKTMEGKSMAVVVKIGEKGATSIYKIGGIGSDKSVSAVSGMFKEFAFIREKPPLTEEFTPTIIKIQGKTFQSEMATAPTPVPKGAVMQTPIAVIRAEVAMTIAKAIPKFRTTIGLFRKQAIITNIQIPSVENEVEKLSISGTRQILLQQITQKTVPMTIQAPAQLQFSGRRQVTLPLQQLIPPTLENKIQKIFGGIDTPIIDTPMPKPKIELMLGLDYGAPTERKKSMLSPKLPTKYWKRELKVPTRIVGVNPMLKGTRWRTKA